MNTPAQPTPIGNGGLRVVELAPRAPLPARADPGLPRDLTRRCVDLCGDNRKLISIGCAQMRKSVADACWNRNVQTPRHNGTQRVRGLRQA